MRCAVCRSEGDAFSLHISRNMNGVICHRKIPVCEACIRTLFTVRGYVEDLYEYLGEEK